LLVSWSMIGVALLTGLAAEDSKGISPTEAIEQIGKPQIVVEMRVVAAKDRLKKRGIIYLDSEADFANPKNLGVAISAEADAKYREKGIDDPATHFKGNTIRVRGCVMRFEQRPYLPVHSPDQIEIVVTTRR